MSIHKNTDGLVTNFGSAVKTRKLVNCSCCETLILQNISEVSRLAELWLIMKPSCLSPAQYKPTCPTYFCFVNKVIQTSPEFVMVIICQGSKCQVDFVNFFSVGRVVASNTRGPGTCLKNGPTPASFCLFSFFSITILQKIVDLSGIWTRIVGVEGEHADHLTTTTDRGLV